MKNGDKSVHPFTHFVEDGGVFPTKHQVNEPGLTKREAFAMAAMQGLCGLEFQSSSSHDIEKAERVANQAVRLADALLSELEK